mgnify:CR=1 FL=1
MKRLNSKLALVLALVLAFVCVFAGCGPAGRGRQLRAEQRLRTPAPRGAAKFCYRRRRGVPNRLAGQPDLYLAK